jgi:4-oxalocrotonate tautomerase family enzyme
VPLAHIYIGPGRSPEVKEALIGKITQAFSDVLGPTKQPVWVVIHEVPLSDWGVDGKPILAGGAST